MSGGAALSPCTCEPFASHSSLMFAFVIPCSTSISAYSLSERAFSASVAAPFSTVFPIISTISTWSFHFSFCRCEISCGMPFALWIAHFTLQNLMSQPSCHGDRTFSPSFTLPFGMPVPQLLHDARSVGAYSTRRRSWTAAAPALPYDMGSVHRLHL